MRIAYVAPYQGPTLLTRRPIVRNRSMSNAVKIELIATLLRERSHDVEVISQGASAINMTFIVRDEDGPDVVRRLHREFFGSC